MQNGLMKCGINFCEPTVGRWHVLEKDSASNLILHSGMAAILVDLLSLLCLCHSSMGLLHNLFHVCNMGGGYTRRKSWQSMI